MKVFISADIEGVAGISQWDETNHEHMRGRYYAEQMTKEVDAACQAAIELGAEVVVRDAHDSARNLNVRQLPEDVKFVRGWARSPMSMMETLDDSFDAVIYIGYHSAAYTPFSPLAHTMSSRKYQKIMINGEIASEFTINTYLSYYHGVPVVALSGDEGLCQAVKAFDDRILTVATQHGIGNSTVSIHPDKAIKQIKAMVKKALSDLTEKRPIEMPKTFEMQIEYKQIADYHAASFYPGVTKIDGRTLAFKSDDFYEVARALMFM